MSGRGASKFTRPEEVAVDEFVGLLNPGADVCEASRKAHRPFIPQGRQECLCHLRRKAHDDYSVVVATGHLLGGAVNGGALPAPTRAGLVDPPLLTRINEEVLGGFAAPGYAQGGFENVSGNFF